MSEFWADVFVASDHYATFGTHRNHPCNPKPLISDEDLLRATSFTYVPDLKPAPRYAELNPGGSTDIVHVITTLEEPSR